MLSKKEVKYIQSLSDKKNRDEEGVFIAEGPKLLDELLAAGLKAKTIYSTENRAKTNIVADEIKKIDATELQRISHFEKATQTLGIFYKKALPPYQLQHQVSLVLDGIQDPGNLGTIIRTADWFGIAQIFASPDTADCYNNKVVQGTMGSIARVSVYYLDLPLFLQEAKMPVLGALLKGENMYKTKPVREGLIVIGNESKGIRAEVLPFIQQAVTIPRIGGAESLNAAVATGILLSHLVISLQ
ncbi:MAG: RNA methyltransferase [Bacteroidota bacterium]|nr:RNA methyltransferase [Bacteroidota bacterium]